MNESLLPKQPATKSFLLLKGITLHGEIMFLILFPNTTTITTTTTCLHSKALFFLAGGMGSDKALFCCFKTVFSFPFIALGVVVSANNPKIIISAVTVTCAVEFYLA